MTILGKILPMLGQILHNVAAFGDYNCEDRDRYATTDLDKAHVTTSMVAGSELHNVVLDIDMPAVLLESSTAGHHHLYIDHQMTWENYVKLLDVMAEVGLLEEGYVGASKTRGHTALRLPWIKKDLDGGDAMTKADRPGPDSSSADLLALVSPVREGDPF